MTLPPLDDYSDHDHACPEHERLWVATQAHEYWRQHRWEDHRDMTSLDSCTTYCPGLDCTHAAA